MTPELDTARLVLKSYRASLVTPQHVAWLNDPEVVKYSEQRHKQHTEQTQHSYLNSFLADDFIWLLVVKSEKKDIGTIAAHVDPPNKVANMGILIGDRSVHGLGYATEAWKEVMRWLFWDKDMRKVECGTMFHNRGMRKVATKAGMELEACKLRHFIVDDELSDMLCYGKFRP